MKRISCIGVLVACFAVPVAAQEDNPEVSAVRAIVAAV